MSSVSQITVARVCSPSTDSPPPESGSGTVAHLVDDGGKNSDDTQPSGARDVLTNAWEDLVRGRLRAWHQTITRDSVRLIARVNCAHPPLCPDDAEVVVRVLCGEAQKVVASDLEVANSTVSGRCVRALTVVGLGSRTVPLPLVLAAQSSAGRVQVPNATSALFDDNGVLCIALSVPRPVTKYLTALTRAEQEVAQALIEGSTRSEIALRRETSMFTVNRQFSAIFSALRLTGRYALIRCAAERGCFS